MMQRNLSKNGGQLIDRVDLQYPVSTLYDRKINIQPSFFGLTLAENNTNGLTNMESAKVGLFSRDGLYLLFKMLAIHFRAERKPSWTTPQIKDFEMSVTNYFEK